MATDRRSRADATISAIFAEAPVRFGIGFQNRGGDAHVAPLGECGDQCKGDEHCPEGQRCAGGNCDLVADEGVEVDATCAGG